MQLLSPALCPLSPLPSVSHPLPTTRSRTAQRVAWTVEAPAPSAAGWGPPATLQVSNTHPSPHAPCGHCLTCRQQLPTNPGACVCVCLPAMYIRHLAPCHAGATHNWSCDLWLYPQVCVCCGSCLEECDPGSHGPPWLTTLAPPCLPAAAPPPLPSPPRPRRLHQQRLHQRHVPRRSIVCQRHQGRQRDGCGGCCALATCCLPSRTSATCCSLPPGPAPGMHSCIG